jgi:hypothetical protein
VPGRLAAPPVDGQPRSLAGLRIGAMTTRLAVAVTLTIALAPLAAGQAGRARMRADLEFQCSPPLEGRASLSRGADAAAWFLATEMRKAGLEPPDASSARS